MTDLNDTTATDSADDGIGDNDRTSAPDLGLSYGEALEELESLLDELEASDTDVDLLAQRVARGVELVRFCRARLEVVTKDVDTVVSELISVESQGDHDGGRDPDPEDLPEDV